MDSPAPHPDLPARTARRLTPWLTVAVVVLAAVLVAERLGYAGAYAGRFSISKAASEFVFSLPALAYLLALWSLRAAAKAIADGATFGAAVTRGLRRTGVLLILGSFLGLGMPVIHGALGSVYPRLIEFDVATLIIAAIGAGLVLLTRVVARAGEVAAELDEMF